MPKQSSAVKFVGALKEYLKKDFGIDSIPEYHLGHERYSFKSDLYFEVSGINIFIEVEDRQPHPDTNVSKYWQWVEENSIKLPVVLVQIFGKEFYGNNYRSRAELCTFIAEKIKKAGINLSYVSLKPDMLLKNSEDWSIAELFSKTKNILKEIINQKGIQ